MAQDDYYYEIQLTNKQLVFYFLAGATGLILSFLAGVMVGRGVDQSAGEVQAARPVAEERVVTEETPKPVPSAAAEDLTYAQRLESDKTDDGLEKPKGGTPSTGRAARAVTPRVTAGAAPGTTAPAAPPTQRTVRRTQRAGSPIAEFTQSASERSTWISRTLAQVWRPLGESNPCSRRERAVSWATRRRGPRKTAFG